MPASPVLLSAREASYVAGIPYAAVRKAFDEGRLRSSMAQRRRGLDAMATIRLAAEDRTKGFPSAVRTHFRNELSARLDRSGDGPGSDPIVYRDREVETALDVKAMLDGIQERLRQVEALRELVVCDEAVQGGAPTFVGTRILVRHIAGLAQAGDGRREITEDFPEVTPDMVELAILYDTLYPKRGRPEGKATQA